MNAAPPRGKLDRLVPWLAALGLLGLGILLLGGLGYDFSGKLVFWRDHPFDRANLRFAYESFSWSARLWAYDPLHLMGWTPNVFYNPLASLAAGLFCAPFQFSAAAYQAWLILLLAVTSLAGWSLLPRGVGKAAWLAGAGVIGLLAWMVYPTDAGIIDGNPVQVLYTGQWAQRMGIALGLLALERYWRALKAWDGQDRRRAAQRLLAAAALWGLSLFSHFMSGYAVALGMGLLSLLHIPARRLMGRAWSPASLIMFMTTLAAMGLLFADFFFAFLSLQADYHHLPLLPWILPEAAFATVQDVLIPGLPLLLLPGLAMMGRGLRDGVALARLGLPVFVLLAAVAAGPASLLPWSLAVLAAGLLAARLEVAWCIRHWLPGLCFCLWCVACGPDSLRPFGLNLDALLPFSSSIGFAKLAAFARLGFMAWLGLLAAESLAELRPMGWKAKATAWSLLGLGLALPLLLALGAERGAQSFFGWVAQTDLQATAALQERVRQVAEGVPSDRQVLAEDLLHYARGSALRGRGLPNGHLIYGLGPELARPVLGGAVTTRYLSHPHTQTSRGQLLCRDFDDLQAADLERLAELGVGDLLVHSPALIQSLRRLASAELVDQSQGLAHFRLRRHVGMVQAKDGTPLEGFQLRYAAKNLVTLVLPAEAPPQSTLRLRLVYLPWLRCEPAEACRIRPWRDAPERFHSCDLAGGREFQVELPWVELDLDGKGPGSSLGLSSAPPIWPWLLMLLAWTAAGFWRYAWPRMAKQKTAPAGSDPA